MMDHGFAPRFDHSQAGPERSLIDCLPWVEVLEKDAVGLGFKLSSIELTDKHEGALREVAGCCLRRAVHNLLA